MQRTSRRSTVPASPRSSISSAISTAFQRSVSPNGRFYLPAGAAAAASVTTSSFASSPPFFGRSLSPTRINLVGGCSPPRANSVRFYLPDSSLSVADRRHIAGAGAGAGRSRKTCMCSPTTHPGSFRCSLHKGFQGRHPPAAGAALPSNRLNARRSAMTNSLIRIATVEGDLVKRALTALIRPSSHQQRRRAVFQQRPSRLSVMSMADDP